MKRLTVELKCQGIKTLQETNIFLRDYITKFNAHFSLEAKEKSAFRPIPKGMDIDHILCVIEKRTYDRGGALSFYHKHFQILEDKDLPHLAPRGRIKMLVNPRFGLKVRHQGNIYDTVPCEVAKKVKRRVKEKKV